MRTVTGEIIFPDDAPSTANLVADIEVLDISEADAPSRVVARQTVEHAEVAPGGTMPFSIEVPETDPRSSLTLRAHVHSPHTEHMGSGDMLTTAVVPVPPTGTPPPLRVRVAVI